MVMARVTIHYVPKEHVLRIWPILYEGVSTYIQKTPHLVGDPNEILANLVSPGGDELLVIMLREDDGTDGRYAGFGTFKILHIEGEVWGTFAMIYADAGPASEAAVLPEAMVLAREYFRGRGCTHMNYFTARKGFQRLAPRLGFRSRIIEWVTEVN
jgi:hypothetical protein